MKRTALALLAALALTGCGGAASPKAAPAASPTLSPTPSPTPSPTALRVSLGGVCPDLVKHLDTDVDIVTDNQNGKLGLSQATKDRLDNALTDLQFDQSVAPESLLPYLGQEIKSLQEIQAGVNGGGTGGFQLDQYKVSAREMLSQCEPYSS